MAATLTSIGGLPSTAVPMTSNLLAFTIKIPKIHATSDRGRETIKCGRVVCCLVETERRLSVKEVGLVLVQSNCYLLSTRLRDALSPREGSVCSLLVPFTFIAVAGTIRIYSLSPPTQPSFELLLLHLQTRIGCWVLSDASSIASPHSVSRCACVDTCLDRDPRIILLHTHQQSWR